MAMRIPKDYPDWVNVREAVEAKGYKMPTLAEYKKQVIGDETDPKWLEKWKILPGDELKLSIAFYHDRCFSATRQSDGLSILLRLLTHGSQEHSVWKALKDVPAGTPIVFPPVLDIINTPTHDVLVLDGTYSAGTYIYPGGLQTFEDMVVAYRFWIELISVLHASNISLRVLDEDLVSSNFLQRSDPGHRTCITNLEYAVKFESNEPPMVTGIPEGVRYHNHFPKWAEENSPYDAFKCDVYCVASYILYDLKGREMSSEPLEALCKKMTTENPNDIPSASQALAEYNSIFPSRA
ncbi:hypothetical protein HDU96_007059 [Phlyctochytrium bullatum]|nr:hypothetical protein HDU96_007059 [Phlyctochytrium bullatum]